MTDTPAAVAGFTALALMPQPLDLFPQATELTADRLVVFLLLLALFLSFSPFVYFLLELLELIELLFQLVDLLPQLASFRFVAPFTTLGFAPFVQFVAQPLEFAPNSAEIAQEFRIAPFVRRPFVVVRLLSPSL